MIRECSVLVIGRLSGLDSSLLLAFKHLEMSQAPVPQHGSSIN